MELVHVDPKLLTVNVNEQGQLDFQLSPEAVEDLMSLKQTKAWQTYRKILIAAKNARLHSAMAQVDPNKVLKDMGEAAGLNLAANQLVLFCDQIEMTRKKQAEKNEKAPPNMRRQ